MFTPKKGLKVIAVDRSKEMVRILKPGGKFVLTDLDEHTHERNVDLEK
ncbi:MAG: hypothetical protein Q8900_10495 [Bacillota bacterium]|nr:hypothetical protein [Bacillota bacterium]